MVARVEAAITRVETVITRVEAAITRVPNTNITSQSHLGTGAEISRSALLSFPEPYTFLFLSL